MKILKKYQHKRILLKNGEIANGDFVIDDEVTLRIKNGYLNDVVDEAGKLLPAIETADGSHVEHWKDGVLHCESEPAVIDNIDGYEEWYIMGKSIDERNINVNYKPNTTKKGENNK